MNKVLICLTFLIISACSNNSEEIKKLKAENHQLKKRLEKIKSELNDFRFSAFVKEKSSTVKLGEEYISEIGILVSKKSNPIKVQLGKFIDNVFQPNDSLMELYSECRVYKQKPDKPGKYNYGGKVELDFFDTTIVRYFQNEYFISR
jgi:hypothetical protein